MTITNDTELPTYEELTVPEINVTAAAYHTVAFQLGAFCEEQSKEFMQCHYELKDPRKCLQEGKVLTNCGLEFFKKVKKSCFQEFVQFQQCLLDSSSSYSYTPCRKPQSIFDECVRTNIGIEKPHPFYFCEPKIHNSKRPKPEPEYPPEFPYGPTALPESKIDEAPPTYHWSSATR